MTRHADEEAAATPVGPLAGRVATAAAWAVGMRIGERLLGIASTIILARLLVPENYGIVAMAMVVIAFVETLTAIGVDAAIISKSHPDRRDYDTAWTLNLGLGVAMSVVIAAAAVPAAAYFKTPEVLPVLLTLAAMPLIGGFENIGTVDFRRHLQFDRDVVFNLGKKLSGLLVAVPLAFLWRSHWALVVGMLTGRVGGLVLSFVMSPYRPRLDLGRARELLHFSKWMLLSNMLVFFRMRSAEVLVGRLHGPASLGIFNMSNELAAIPSSELVMPINRALFPGYSKVSQDLERLRSGFLKALGLISLLAIPASAGLALVAQYAVPLLLGPSWLEAIPVVEILAVSGVSVALQTNNWSIFLALRRPEMLVKITLVHIIVLLGSIFLLVPRFGAVGAAFSQLAAGLVSLPVNYVMIKSTLGMRIRTIMETVWRPLAGSAAMYGVVSWFGSDSDRAGAAFDGMLASLLQTMAAGAVIYSLTVIALWLASGRPPGAETHVIEFATSLGRRLRHSASD